MAKMDRARVFVHRSLLDVRVWKHRARRKMKITIKTNENEHDAD